MAKVGIIFCGNARQDCGCSSFLCLKDARTSRGAFAAHVENGGTELYGVVDCAGCPTAVAPDKILGPIRELISTGADTVHLANCMMSLCPFRSRYAKVIEEAYPDINLVQGTHAPPDQISGDEADRFFKQGIRQMLCQDKVQMSSMVEKAREIGLY